MTSKDSPKGRRQGPKRSQASTDAILAAAREEITENGWRGFSADRLARRARASKQTIYRWWPSIAAIVVEALMQAIPEADSATGGPTEERISRLLMPIETLARQGDGARFMRHVLTAAADDMAAGQLLKDWLTDHVRQPLRLVLAEAATKGDIRRDWDIDQAVDILLGPLWYRLLALRGPVPQHFSDRAAQTLMTALRA